MGGIVDDHGLGMLRVRHYLTSSGDVQQAGEYMSQEFTGGMTCRATRGSANVRRVGRQKEGNCGQEPFLWFCGNIVARQGKKAS